MNRNETLAILAVLTCSSCQGSGQPPAHEDGDPSPPPEAKATSTLALLRDQGLDVAPAKLFQHADGTFGYLLARSREPGKISAEFAIDDRGMIEPPAEARAEFARVHYANWGTIGLQTATRLLTEHAAPEDYHRFLAFYRADYGSRLALEEAREIDPHAEALEGVSAVQLQAPIGDVLRSLAYSPIFASIVDAEPATGQRAAVANAKYSTAAISSLSDTFFNANNDYGDDVSVGILETFREETKERPCASSADCGGGTCGTSHYCRCTSDGSCGAGAYCLGYNGENICRKAGTRGCNIYHQHEAFANLSGAVVNYQNARVTNNGDCTAICGAGSLPKTDGIGAYCVEKWGGEFHSTEVASRISASQQCGAGDPAFCQSGPHHAAKVKLWVGQAHWTDNHDANDYNISVSNLYDSYQWFHQNAVQIVSQSYGSIPSPIDYRSIFRDWYAKHYGMVFTVASGNDPSQGTWCSGWTDLCVGSLDLVDNLTAPKSINSWGYGLGLGNFLLDLHLDAESAWKNQVATRNVYGMPVSLEIEQPRLMAEGQSASVAIPTTTRSWGPDSGTSFAAPAVAGVLAMLEKSCDFLSLGGDANLFVRSYLAAHTGWHFPVGLDSLNCPLYYPTAYYDEGHFCDFHAGWGPINSMALWSCPLVTCGVAGQPPCPVGSVGGGDALGTPKEIHVAGVLTGGSFSNPPSQFAANPPAGNAASTPGGVQGLHRAFQNGKKWRPLADVNLEQGGPAYRFRGALAYYSCPGHGTLVPPNSGTGYVDDNGMAVNLDLAVCGHTVAGADKCLWASENLDESVEGFDITLPEAYSTVTVYVVTDMPDPGHWGCNDAGESYQFTMLLGQYW